MSKRTPIDMNALTALTMDEAVPMAEAVQRSAAYDKPLGETARFKPKGRTHTEDLVALAFKVPPDFDQRYRRTAFEAGKKLNELLFEALDAWETKNRR